MPHDRRTIAIGLFIVAFAVVVGSFGFLFLVTPIFPMGLLMIFVGLGSGYFGMHLMTKAGAFETTLWKREVRLDGWRPTLDDVGEEGPTYYMREPSDTRHMVPTWRQRKDRMGHRTRNRVLRGSILLFATSLFCLLLGLLVLMEIPGGGLWGLFFIPVGLMGWIGSFYFFKARHPLLVLVATILVILVTVQLMVLIIGWLGVVGIATGVYSLAILGWVWDEFA
jgi:hypothetical protein